MGTDIDAVMDTATKVDSHTVKVSLTRPDSRFMFLLTYKLILVFTWFPNTYLVRTGQLSLLMLMLDFSNNWSLRVVAGTPEQKVLTELIHGGRRKI